VASQEPLALLRQGVDSWKEGREKNPQISPDLTEARLSEADLTGTHLRRKRGVRVRVDPQA
jgi:hypothetical protein